MQFDTSSLWIYIYLPNLQLNVQEAEGIHLQEPNTQMGQQRSQQARIVYDPKLNQVIQLNRAAAKLGIKHGMGLASASLLCAELAVSEYKLELAKQTLESLANELYLLTSDIVIDEPHGLYLRAQNMLRLYGSLEHYWQAIKRSLAQHSFDVYYASAYSVNVAKLIAKHRRRFMSDNKTSIAQELKQCTLSMSDIDRKDIEKLQRVGVKTIDDLLSHPLSELATRVSKLSLHLIAELRGEAPAKLRFYQPPEHYQQYLELLYDIELVDKLLPVLERCLQTLESYLLVRNALALSLTICLHQREHEPIEQVINSAQPLYKSAHWLDIIALRFESLSLSSAVYGITLSCRKIEKADLCDSDFFTQKSTHIAAMTLLSRLQAKLGEEQVSLLHYSDDYRPECNSRYHQQQDNRKRIKATKIYLDRPGFLLKEPRPLQGKAQIIDGPERIVSGWWDKQEIQRDYFLAQSQQGQQLWIFRTPKDEWFIHGYFI
ncbi:DNA polymerase Y family protein [Alteromonas sp. W364]|uniref:Y-family DNA polymerase n=1 Tax=Alteromonas sp. W364 TaxID=3075610 RepID=UPI002886F957|nr:DNA polymerase Y family protein [Alteromonas sp. W364]MDT0628130.1 DNA polymerase Y family protein [Alteromonas sp. W364]